MILDSTPWKEALIRRAASLSKRKSQRHWPEASLAEVEEDVMLAAYAMRKLAEAMKVSDSTASQRIPIRSYAALGKPITRLNWHRFEELYDMTTSSKSDITLRPLCNEIMHSYVFAPQVDTSGLRGIFVSSDHNRHKRLVQVGIDDLLAVMRSVGEDYPQRVKMAWDADLRDYKVESS